MRRGSCWKLLLDLNLLLYFQLLESYCWAGELKAIVPV
jgi:hypothetical protein